MSSAAVTHNHAEHDDHPPLSLWVKIAIFLGIVTAIEVAIYYIPALEGVLVPLLIALSAIKLVVVIGYFMHLKFDDNLLSFIFGAALIVSIIMFIALWVVMYYDNPTVFHPNTSIFDQKPTGP